MLLLAAALLPGAARCHSADQNGAQKHSDDSQEGSNGVSDNIFQRIVVWNQQDVEYCSSWQITCQ